MGKSNGIPIAVIRGFEYVRNENAVINGLIREREKDLFR
jgi:F420-0:gamma-glutamyl ligase